MTIKIAINGYGRIGRNMLRAHCEGNQKYDIQIVGINDLGNPQAYAHVTKCNTTHGSFPGIVSVDEDCMVANGDHIRVLSSCNPEELPWGELGMDVVPECSGIFTTMEKVSPQPKPKPERQLARRRMGFLQSHARHNGGIDCPQNNPCRKEDFTWPRLNAAPV
jgi:glyceraldehyde 3-phosphate dehydrogenase